MLSPTWSEALANLELTTRDLGMENTFRSAKELRRVSTEMGQLNHGLVGKTEEAFLRDLNAFDITHRKAILLLTKEIPSSKKSKKNRPVSWTLEDKEVRISSNRADSNLEVLVKEFNSTDDSVMKILLMGLGIIILYTQATDYTKGLIDWLSRSMDHQRSAKFSESVFEKVVIFDWRYYEDVKDEPKWKGRPISDIAHVRHAFAHSNYRLIPPDRIELWNADPCTTGYPIYKRIFSSNDLLSMFNGTQERLILLDTLLLLIIAKSTPSRPRDPADQERMREGRDD